MKVIMEINGQVLLSGVCVCCQKNVRFQVNETEYNNYVNGMLIQNAFPTLSADKREMIISNMCGNCFDKTFKDEEELTECDFWDGDETDKQ